jgi:divalent metal cation (Fe/Co/Zn/Cd) transporter
MVKTAKNGLWGSKPICWLQSTAFGSRFLHSKVFRSQVSLHCGLVINLTYVALKLVTGILYRSVWLIALSGFYLLLAIMCSVLVGYVHQEKIGENIPREFCRYRACGYALLVMNQALAVIVGYIVHENQGYSYPGLLIYGMALYAFYAMITAIINVVKFRKLGSPILSAAMIVNLTAAMVSMLSLETAMLSEFGSEDARLRLWMTGISGGVVCTVVLALAVYMLVRASKTLKQVS